MKLIILGSGTGTPSLKRNASGLLMKIGQQNLIFDAHAEEIRKYMCGIVTNLGSKPITVSHTGSLP